jgi:hypothetical protein
VTSETEIKKVEVGEKCNTPVKIRNVRTVLMGKAERKRPLARPRHKKGKGYP